MNIQTILLVLVSLLVAGDALLTWYTYKQNEQDYTDMKYDIEAYRTQVNLCIDNHNCMHNDVAKVNREIQALNKQLALWESANNEFTTSILERLSDLEDKVYSESKTSKGPGRPKSKAMYGELDEKDKS